MEKIELLFRRSPAPSVSLPLGARSVGHYIWDGSRREPSKQKHFYQFFWGIGGQGIIYIKNRRYLLLKNYVVFYKPGDTHRIIPLKPYWEYRWWTMDGPKVGNIISAFGLRNRKPYLAGPYPHELFIKLESEIRDPSPNGERSAAATAFALLSAATMSPSLSRLNTPNNKIIDKCVKILKQDFTNPDITIEQIALRLNLNRTNLSKKFLKYKGITPIKYLISLRVQKALSLIKTTNLSIAKIAYRVGFNDPNYFSRFLKQTIGKSPREFRK